ncbi:hypothetical protein ASF77_07465 [Massilia sp. Leaf139]|nr:hypothetical protein ASF77_07465 [Massilia sp. Leaf139]
MIERFGLMAGLRLLWRRLRLCGETHHRPPLVRNPVLHYQHGDCDPGCGADCLPDMPSGSGISRCVGDFLCSSCSCDGSTSADRKKKDEQYT